MKKEGPVLKGFWEGGSLLVNKSRNTYKSRNTNGELPA